MPAPAITIYPRLLCLAPMYAPPRATGGAPAVPAGSAGPTGAGPAADPDALARHIDGVVWQLDTIGVRQVIVCGHPAGAPHRDRLGDRTLLRRVGPRALFSPIAGVALMRLARIADVLHLYYAADFAALAIAAGTASAWDVPLVITVHESKLVAPEPSDAAGRARLASARWLERTAARRAAAVICPTHALAERFATEGVPQRRIHVFSPELDAADSARQLLEIYRAVWARYLARQVAIWHPTPG